MQFRKNFGITLAGIAAGAVNGLLGAGGGMVLVPLLTMLTDLKDEEIFPASVGIILPVCLVSLCLSITVKEVPWDLTALYLIGSAAGGILAGFLGKRIPTKWLHKALGILVIWGGVRYLC